MAGNNFRKMPLRNGIKIEWKIFKRLFDGRAAKSITIDIALKRLCKGIEIIILHSLVYVCSRIGVFFNHVHFCAIGTDYDEFMYSETSCCYNSKYAVAPIFHFRKCIHRVHRMHAILQLKIR